MIGKDDASFVKLGGITAILAAALFVTYLVIIGQGERRFANPLEVVDMYSGPNALFNVVGDAIFGAMFILVIPTVLSLFAVLRETLRNYTLLATILSIVGMLLFGIVQVGLQVFTIPLLASEFAKATAQTKDVILVMVKVARNVSIVAVFLSDLFIAIAMGLFAISMKRSGLFSKKVVWLGGAISILGLMGTAVAVPFFTSSQVGQEIAGPGLLLIVVVVAPVIMLIPWMIATGIRLIRLASKQS